MQINKPNADRVRLVAVTLAVTVAAALPVYLTGALAVQIRTELHMTESQFGMSLASYFVTATLGSLALGGVVDRRGWSSGLRAAAIVSALALASVGSVVHSWPALLVCLIAAGFSGALAQPSSNLALARRLPVSQQGLSFGAKQAAIPLAVLLGGLAVPTLSMTAGWRLAFLAAAGIAVIAAIGVPKDGMSVVPGGHVVSRQRRVPWALLCVTIAGGLGAAAGNALGGFLVTAAVGGGWTEKAAAELLIQGSLAGLVVRLLAGWFANQQYRRSLEILILLLALGALGFGLLALNKPSTWLPGTLLAFGAGWGWSGVFHLAVVMAHDDSPAMATGVTQAGTFAGSGLGPFAFGLLAEHVSLANAWWLAALWQLLAVGLVLASRRAFQNRSPQDQNADAVSTS